jgi:pimeloyl-ACP methyl ester carboxylesterase
MRVFYLHGFASSAKSSKAIYLSGTFAARGIPFEAPDLNEPDFATLTVSRMVAQVVSAIDAGAGPVVLIGSSLGAFVAVQVALQRPDAVTQLVLLAPALDVGTNSMPGLDEDGLDRWKTSNALDVFHYAYGRMIPIHYELYADAGRHDSMNAALTMPVQVFQGRRDTSVDPDMVERWCRARPYVDLHLLDDDHQLLASLDSIWREMDRFLFGSSSSRPIPDPDRGSPRDRS